jgi:hypothetical protein
VSTPDGSGSRTPGSPVPSPGDIALQRVLGERLRRAGIANVIGVHAPSGPRDEWLLSLHGGGANAEARAALAAMPGVSDVRRSRTTGSLVTFALDPERVEP